MTFNDPMTPNDAMTINDAMTKQLPALAWLIIITILSTQGGVSMPAFNLIQTDKLAHAAAYGLLVWLILFGWFWDRPGRMGWVAGFWVFSAATAYGAFMEFVQYSWFPNRFFEVDDMLANAVGAAAAWLTFDTLKKRFRSFWPVKS